MLAQTLEIIRAVRRNIFKSFAFASFGVAQSFTIDWVEMFVLFESVVAEAFGFWADHFALVSFRIFPAEIKSVGIFGFIQKAWSIFVHEVELFVIVNFDRHSFCGIKFCKEFLE